MRRGPTARLARAPIAAGAAMLRKLDLRSVFTEDERATLLALPRDDASFSARQPIVHEGDVLTRSCVLVDGYAARFKLLPDGSRQIVSLHIAGDVMDAHAAVLGVADHGIAALTHARVAYLPHAALLDAADRSPGIARAFWRETLVDGAIFREWLVNIGQRDAYARLAHLICEMAVRFEAIGLSRDDCIPLPLTQTEIGDATALTPVHVNRTMQKLKASGLISTRGSELRIADWDALAKVASFDAGYLYLPN